MLYNEDIIEALKDHDMSLISYCNNEQMYGLQVRVGKLNELLSFKTYRLKNTHDLEKLIQISKKIRSTLFRALYKMDYTFENKTLVNRRNKVADFRLKLGQIYVRSSSGYAFVAIQQYTKVGASTKGYVTRFTNPVTKTKTSQFFRVGSSSSDKQHSEDAAFIAACKWVDNHLGVKVLKNAEYLNLKKPIVWNSWDIPKLANSAQGKLQAS